MELYLSYTHTPNTGTKFLFHICALVKGKGKGQVHPRTVHEGPDGESRYSSTLSLTSTLDGVGGQHHAPTALPQGETRYPLYRRLREPQGPSEQVRKISPTTGIRSQDRPVRSESLYRLSYPGPPLVHLKKFLKVSNKYKGYTKPPSCR